MKTMIEHQHSDRPLSRYRILLILGSTVFPLVLCTGLLLGFGWFVVPWLMPDWLLAWKEPFFGNTPQAQIHRYLHAITQEDETTALTVWEVARSELMEVERAPDGPLRERHLAITRSLIAQGVTDQFEIKAIQWWALCCLVYHRVESSLEASGARLLVLLYDQQGRSFPYVFDIFHRPGRYIGELADYPPHEWVIRDVYPVDAPPLFWPTAAERGNL